MRVISQNWDTDLDYESFVFTVRNTNFDDTSIIEEKGYKLNYVITAVNSVHEYIMASYSTKEKACDVLKSMSDTYNRYIIITKDNNMQITDDFIYEIDRSFEKIDIKPFEALTFVFPTEEEVEI